MKLVPADNFDLEQLTKAYNQTRVDYIVPMPMNEARLRDYINCYDVDLSASWVAVEGSVMLGLGMLGVRRGRGWITRVGVLPSGPPAAVTETRFPRARFSSVCGRTAHPVTGPPCYRRIAVSKAQPAKLAKRD
jgi:hypothetical protein